MLDKIRKTWYSNKEKKMHPIDEYLFAIEDHKKNNTVSAGNYLHRAIGSEIISSAINNNLSRILDINSVAHKVVLPLIVHESKKREKIDGRKLL